ncbi:helix-turn-helix domain-containing protein [Mucilaginibacter sp. HC2]|uniref:helix-turn-helix domain-containing protein n=1 Tax=Mucilaginibacter inviolabilis TaxID=2714892 RepID=UPI0014081AAA|nr:helix-turn-helix domain-containing protein [Mucilaginibacter inviolabilis]NHA07713.1 helix-turn-helix domain-containing protein [Mucilaginibacter inviolabilis]
MKTPKNSNKESITNIGNSSEPMSKIRKLIEQRRELGIVVKPDPERWSEFDEYKEPVEASEPSIEKYTAQGFENNYKIHIKRGKAFLCSLYVLHDLTLSDAAVRLFFMISSLAYNEGYCWASNPYLAQLMGKSESSVKLYLNELKEKGMIANEVYKEKHTWHRRIHIQFAALRRRYMKFVKKK